MPYQQLTNAERRVIANLSIPRNVLDLTQTLRSDPYLGALAFDPRETLGQLAELGWVTNLGDGHSSPGTLAARLEQHATARAMPDEKAQIYESRLAMPHRAWRWQGDQWVMTDEGFAALHEPVGDPTPLPTAIVSQIIAAEARRVHSGEVTDDVGLGERLLEEEYLEWVRAVCDAHEEATGERPQAPIGGGAGYSDATELLILDPENGKGSAYTETAPWFMAAVTVAVTDADTGSTITEANYTGYGRKSVAAADMNTAAAGAATNANPITFAACTGGTSAVIGFAKCVAATVGRLIKYGTCATVNVSSTQQPLSFAAAAFTSSLD